MRKISLSLTEQNIEWLQQESDRRGLAVSDLIRRMIDDACLAQMRAMWKEAHEQVMAERRVTAGTRG